MSKIQTQIKVNDIVEGEIYKITKFGAFVKLPLEQRGLIHISQISNDYVQNISDHLKIGDKIKARVITVDGNKIDLTIKRLKDYISIYPKDKDFKSSALGEKLNTFLKTK